MYQRDYILRMIEMMAQFIAAILAILRKGSIPEARQMLETAYYDFLKQDAAFFHGIPEDRLTDELIGQHHFTHGHLELLSELFYAEGEVEQSAGNHDLSLACYRKALRLVQFIVDNSDTFSPIREERILLLRSKIQ